ncbi:MAG: hypothetical protein GY953_38620, partial [bacterium]|nr:hypothetical protein [bacterium]
MDAARQVTSQRDPHFLPDGRRFLYVSFAATENGIWVGSLDGEPPRFLFSQSQSPARYAPGPGGGHGHILFVRNRQLLAQPFDPDRAEITGEAWVVAEPVRNGPTFWTSRNGVLAYRGAAAGMCQLTWFGRQGKLIRTIGEPGPIHHPTLSPDQRAVAYHFGAVGAFDIWVLDLERAVTTRHTFSPGSESSPLWTRDGSNVIHHSSHSGKRVLVSKPASGAGEEEVDV